MNTLGVDSAESRKEQHERASKLFGGYTAFMAALLIATIAKSNDFPRSWIVISLLAVSLPSLVAFNLLDYGIRVIQGRRKSASRGLAFALGCLPSIAALSILIGHFSVIAAVLLVLLILFWSLALDVVAYLGAQDPHSDI